VMLIVVESPYAATSATTVEEHETYTRRCLADSLARGEAPYASHALYTQPGVLDDTNPIERKRGIEAGFKWGGKAAQVAVYTDYGISRGMREGIERAKQAGQPIVYRQIGKNKKGNPMTDDFIPTTHEVRETYADATCIDLDDPVHEIGECPQEQKFDRWLASVESELREQVAADVRALLRDLSPHRSKHDEGAWHGVALALEVIEEGSHQ